MLEVLSLPLLVECSFEDSLVGGGPESETRRSIVSSVKDILGASNLQWEAVLARFVELAPSVGGTDKPVDAALLT